MRKLNVKMSKNLGRRNVVTPEILKRRKLLARAIQKDAERLVTRITTLTKQWA